MLSHTIRTRTTPQRMTSLFPMLRLVPLAVLECTASLIEKGKTPTNEWISSFTADGSILNTEAKASEEYKRPRNTIALKLCPANTDIVDLDDDYEPERVIHSSKFDDGSVAATVSLGRNNATGIIWTAISRAVCDVSLSTTSSSNKRGVAVASLGMRKPAGKHHVYLDGELIDKPLGREIPLQDGSIISLLGPNGMAYQVHIFQSGDDPKASDAICNYQVGKCCVCWDEPRGLVFIPCGHLTTCRPCGEKIYRTGGKCHICREEIKRINDVFID